MEDAGLAEMVARTRSFIRRLKHATPVRTGYMQSNWYWRRQGKTVVVSNRAVYAAKVIENNEYLNYIWEEGP